MLTGLSAFPLTPMNESAIDEAAFSRLVERLVAAGDVPVIVGISALRTRDVLALAEDAQAAGASAVLLAPMSYQPLADEEVFGLFEAVTARERVARLRALIPSEVTIGVSGDAFAAIGLNAGCDAWYSVICGLFPETALAITRAARAGRQEEATALSQRLDPL